MQARDDQSGEARSADRPGKLQADWTAIRSRVRYGTSLRLKLIALALLISCFVVGALFWFAFSSLHSSIRSIYEQRARSVAALISKSIEEKDYVLYYSDELDAEIRTLLTRHESILGIRVIGETARGLVTVASTDPTIVGRLVPDETAERYERTGDVTVETVRQGAHTILRAYSPITSSVENAGMVVVDMSLSEETAYVRHLSWTFAVAAAGGVLLLGTLIYLALTGLVTRPVRRLARAAAALTQRNYNSDAMSAPRRTPGVAVRDEVSRLEDSFRLMSKVIRTHEQELRKLVILDEVTGLYNTAHFRAQLSLELAKSKRYRHPTSLLVVDMDGLRDVSTADADRVRVRAAGFLLAGLRRVDAVFRTGTNRLVALLPETPRSGAQSAADRLRAYTGDVTSEFDFPVSLAVTAMGWGPDEDVPTDAILRLLGIEAEGQPE